MEGFAMENKCTLQVIPADGRVLVQRAHASLALFHSLRVSGTNVFRLVYKLCPIRQLHGATAQLHTKDTIASDTGELGTLGTDLKFRARFPPHTLRWCPGVRSRSSRILADTGVPIAGCARAARHALLWSERFLAAQLHRTFGSISWTLLVCKSTKPQSFAGTSCLEMSNGRKIQANPLYWAGHLCLKGAAGTSQKPQSC